MYAILGKVFFKTIRGRPPDFKTGQGENGEQRL